MKPNFTHQNHVPVQHLFEDQIAQPTGQSVREHDFYALLTSKCRESQFCWSGSPTHLLIELEKDFFKSGGDSVNAIGGSRAKRGCKEIVVQYNIH